MSQSKYTKELRRKAVRPNCQASKSVWIVAEEPAIAQAAIKNWRRKYQGVGKTRPSNRRTGVAHGRQIIVDAEEYCLLKCELELAWQERDIKKAVAYFAQPPK